MAVFPIPRRRYESELLDSHTDDEAMVLRTVRDITRSNLIFQGARAAVAELAAHFARLPKQATLLDVGTGLGDVPFAAARAAGRHDIVLTTIGLDSVAVLTRCAAGSVSASVCGNALALPFRDASVDVVMCSQTLHHFRGDEEIALLREMNRVARLVVIVSDLRRSWIAAGGFWLASFPLRFHRVTRHDGVLSVLRGYTAAELSKSVFVAIGIRPHVRERLGFRLTASWVPSRSQEHA